MAITAAQMIGLVDANAAVYAALWGDGLLYGCGRDSLPLTDSANPLAGTVSSNGVLVTGSGTAFLTDFAVGDPIKASSFASRIQMISSDTRLVIANAPAAPWAGATYKKAGDWGNSKKARDLENLIYGVGATAGLGDYNLVNMIGPVTHQIQQLAAVTKQVAALYQGHMLALNSLAVNTGLAGVTNLDTLAGYYNIGAGGPFALLFPPDFALMYYAVYGVWPTPTNVFSPVIANMAQLAVTGAGTGNFTAGCSVDTVKFAGCPNLDIIVTGLAGNGLVTLTVSGYNSSGTLVTGNTSWTITINANGTFALTPAGVVKTITAVTGISIAAGITAGTLVISGKLPTSRTNPVVT